ncbi:hypothetical protein [Tsukamurella pulmonis]|uniref:hypothetical protein n=1 Tax=Tsukamurella pulmonis TaxID=47312 RepID=UPI001058D18C|nr:hypothetical protein [Tsukamurella pulmonis]
MYDLGMAHHPLHRTMRLPRASTLVALPPLLLAGCSTGRTDPNRKAENCNVYGADGNAIYACNMRNNALYQAQHEAANSPLARLQEAATPLAFAGLFALVIGLVLLSSGPADVPRHRDQRGPAWGAARASAGQRKCAGWVLVAAGLTAALWNVAVDQRVPMVLAAVAVAALAAWRASVLEAAKAGFDEADRDWQAEASLAELAGERPPNEPVLTVQAAVDLGRRGGWHPVPGGALEALTDRRGGIGPAARAGWHAVAQAMGAGSVSEAGRFTPWAELVSVTDAGNGADARVTWRTSDVTKIASHLGALMPQLAREWRVESIGTVQTDHSTGDLYAIVSNGSAQPEQPAEPESAPEPGWDF